ncbi:NACHT domain-containing protein [Leptolyngbya sp. CCY15150]|uniref:NACHT domain-containing protein n=1 Tax=Leptolyngbya sp. CCY15150 TaxID=2767772 RepID=UPI00194FFB19|nr:NACHT domain-containing protein [Leptolyngbya sp. CCY15150]
MLETVVGAIAGPIFEQVFKVGKFVTDDMEKTKRNVNDINKRLAACQKYEQRYRDRHGRIKIMPGLMKEDVPLESVYTAIKLLDDRSRRYFRTEQDLEEAYRQSARRSFQLGTGKRHDGMEVANQHQFLMVLGAPGIGKSTFLRKLGMEALKPDSQLQKGQIPVFIELKTMKDPGLNLVEVIAKEFEVCGFPAAQDFTNCAISQGKLLILFDGLDEVPTLNLNHVTECIENFVDQYDQNCFVASCRIAAYKSSFRRFTDVTIAEFDDEQIEQFIRRWFHSDLDNREKTADKYWQLLSQPEHKATKELAQTPLLLTFLCLVYDREQILPPNRSTLYGDALNILMKEWSAQKRLERDPIYEGFHPDLEKELLAQIAYDSFKQDQLFFSKKDITERIAEFLADTLNAPKHLDGAAVLKAIEVQQGILVERATNTYSFSHLTIQEYLTAQYIVDQGLVDELVEQHIIDKRWREVFLLVAGLLRGRIQTLLSKMEKSAGVYAAKSQKVENLIAWAQYITDTQNASLNTRAAALSIASASNRNIDIDIARASGIDITIDIARDIAIDIARARDIDIDIDRTRARARDIDRAIAIARDSARDSASLIYAIQDNIFTSKTLEELPKKLNQLQESIPRRDAPSQEWKDWANRLLEAWLNGFNLTKENTSFTKEEAQTLVNYLYITELLIRCKEAATRISKKDWEAMESRLLTLKDIP